MTVTSKITTLAKYHFNHSPQTKRSGMLYTTIVIMIYEAGRSHDIVWVSKNWRPVLLEKSEGPMFLKIT